MRRDSSEGPPSVWLAALPLWLIPLAGWAGAAEPSRLAGVLSLVSLLALALATKQTADQAAGSPTISQRQPARIGAWEMALLVFALHAGVLYLSIGARVTEIADNDGAYYYGVARHMAQSGRFEEPIVWHFLAPPDAIVHAPFDYWGCLTTLLLVPSLALFGATPETAFVTMGAISAASVVAFWYLVCVALPLRDRATQVLALLLFTFSPTLAHYRFQPESTAVAHLFTLLSLIALCRQRLVLALLLGFCVFLTRGDGLILFGSLFIATLVVGWQDRPQRGRRVATSVLVGLACAATYVVWSLMSFGTVTPPGPRMLPLLGRYQNVFDFGAVREPTPGQILDLFRWDYAFQRLRRAWLTLQYLLAVPAPRAWLAMAAVAGLGLLRRPTVAAFIWLLCFAGYAAVAVVSGPGFNPRRSPLTFIPLIILAGAVAIDPLLTALRTWAAGRRNWPPKLLLGTACFALWFVFLRNLQVYAVPPATSALPVQAQLAQLDDVLGGEPVASNLPWYMMAYTQSPAVMIPSNGEGAIAAVLARYRVRWMVIFGVPPLWVEGESRRVLMKVVSGNQTQLGGCRLERAAVATPQAVFRVQGDCVDSELF